MIKNFKCLICGSNMEDDESKIFHVCKHCHDKISEPYNFEMDNGVNLGIEEIAARPGSKITGNVLILKMDDGKPADAVCPICGRPFHRFDKNQVSCGHCYYIKKCVKCGRNYLTRYENSKYCSKHCLNHETLLFEFADECKFTEEDKTILRNKVLMNNINSKRIENDTNFPGKIVYSLKDKTVFATTEEVDEEDNVIIYYYTNEIDKIVKIIKAKFVMDVPTDENELRKAFWSLVTPVPVITSWSQVKEGDTLSENMDVVKYVYPYSKRRCYKITSSKGSFIAADSHFIKVEITDSEGNVINKKVERKLPDDGDTNFATMEFIYNYNIIEGRKIKIVGIDDYTIEKYEKSDVRCVETEKHEYTINGIISHNCTRYMYYALSDTYIMEGECNNPDSSGILECTAPGGFCECCAKKSGMRPILNQLMKEQKGKGLRTLKIGGLISTNLNEPLTQLYLDSIHNSSSATSHTNIVNTYDCYASSPIIKKAAEETTTLGKRKVIYEGLKEIYSANDVKIDDYNLQIIAKKMTSYKRTPEGIKLINEDAGEVCDVISIRAIGGNTSSNIFKSATFSTSFDTISKGGEVAFNDADSFNDIFREDL